KFFFRHCCVLLLRYPISFQSLTHSLCENTESLFMTPSYKLPPIATLAAPRHPPPWAWPAKSESEERTCQNQRRLQNQIRVIMSPGSSRRSMTSPPTHARTPAKSRTLRLRRC